jgi:hypothetical protein
MTKKLKLTLCQKETLLKLSAHDGFLRWDELHAPGPTLARLLDLRMVERGKIGATSAWAITGSGRVALGV